MNSTYDQAVQWLRTQAQRHGGIVPLGESLNASRSTFHRVLSHGPAPSADKFLDWVAQLGGKLVLPDGKGDTGRDVCFVDARIVPAGDGQNAPTAEDYLAVPLVEEVGAGPGIIPQGELLSWFLIYRHQQAVRYRRDLIAVQIGKQSTSMLPTLAPGDIVLVDRQDRDVTLPGHIMLVMDPEGAGKVKRVATEERGRDFRITYYSDNAASNPPEVYSLRDDFLNDWEKVIVGRVIWAWSDISEK